jgi:hypothetical protein
MKAIITLVMGFLLSFSASANDFAAVVGFRSTSASAAGPVTAGVDIGAKNGYGVGVLGFFDMAANFQIRSGFLYNTRDVNVKTALVDFDMNAAYVDIPVTAMYKFAEYGGFFAGPVLALLASKDCKQTGGCTKDPEATALAFQLGASFKFAPQLGGEVYYEILPSEYWKDNLKDIKTVGVNLLFTFE